MNKNKGIMALESVRGDEYFTRDKDAEVIAQHIIRPMTVWLPFNDKGKAFDRVLPGHGHKVICTESDFFETEPPKGVEAVISNPPFSRKKDVVKRLDALGLKYALIMPFLWLNDGVPFDSANQLMMFRKRMFFMIEGKELNKPRQNCVVISNGLLTHDFIVNIEKKAIKTAGLASAVIIVPLKDMKAKKQFRYYFRAAFLIRAFPEKRSYLKSGDNLIYRRVLRKPHLCTADSQNAALRIQNKRGAIEGKRHYA